MSTIYPIHRYRFVELYYRRSDQTKDKTSGAAKKRIETTVIFLPDVSSIMPNRGIEWDDVCKAYSDTLKNVIASHEKPEEDTIVISDDNSESAVVCAIENVEPPPVESGDGTLAGHDEQKTTDDDSAADKPEQATEDPEDTKALILLY